MKTGRDYWTVRVLESIRDGAELAAKANGGTIGEYLEGLIHPDLVRRGLATAGAPAPAVGPTAHARIVDYVRQAGAPVGPAAIATALDIHRASVDSALSRAVGKGEIVRIGEGLYQGPPPPRARRRRVAATRP